MNATVGEVIATASEQAPPLMVVRSCPVHQIDYTTSPVFGNAAPNACPKCAAESMQKAIAAERANTENQRTAAAAKRIQEKLDRNIELACIPTRFRGYRIDTFPVESVAARLSANRQENLRTVLSTCRTYVNKWPQMRKDGANLVFVGNPGTGKTGLALSIANAVMHDYHATAVFISAYGAVRHQRDTWGKKDKRELDALKDLVEPDLLILDEVGVQIGGELEMVMLWEVLNARYADRKPTVLISNLPIDDYKLDRDAPDQAKRIGLRTFLGERAVDRLLDEESHVLRCRWQSLRTKA